MLLLVALAGCAVSEPTREEVQAWVGRPAAALERDWGPPTRTVTSGTERVLIYEQLERASSADFGRTVSPRQAGGTQAAQAASEAARGPRIHVRSYLFWVDPGGTIVRSELRMP